MIGTYKMLKEKHPDAIILLRANDYYHTLMEDAVVVSEKTGITVTKKDGVKMTSFPYYKLDEFLPILVRAGYRIAISDTYK